jgi:hypothetical protein
MDPVLIITRELELSHFNDIINDKDKALDDAHDNFARHRQVLDEEILALRRRLDVAERARDEAEKELQRLQLDRVVAAFTTADDDEQAVGPANESAPDSRVIGRPFSLIDQVYSFCLLECYKSSFK